MPMPTFCPSTHSTAATANADQLKKKNAAIAPR